MPAALIPIIGAIVGAAGVGTSLYEMASAPSAPDPNKGAADQLKKDQEAKAKADADMKQKAILGNLANAQEQGGGALNAPSLTDLAAVIAGLPGEAASQAGKGALSSYLGTPSATTGNPSQDTMVGATYGLSGSQG